MDQQQTHKSRETEEIMKHLAISDNKADYKQVNNIFVITSIVHPLMPNTNYICKKFVKDNHL